MRVRFCVTGQAVSRGEDPGPSPLCKGFASDLGGAFQTGPGVDEPSVPEAARSPLYPHPPPARGEGMRV